MKLFSVTAVLRPFVSLDGIPPEVLRAAAERGRRVHAAVAAELSGLFLVQKLPPAEIGYLESFRRWRDIMISEILEVEQRHEDRRLGYFGHPDLVAVLRDGRRAVIDIKTPATEAKTWRAQLAAYRHLVEQVYGKGIIPIAVMLDHAGRVAKAIRYDRTDADFAAFLSALNAYRYFQKDEEAT